VYNSEPASAVLAANLRTAYCYAHFLDPVSGVDSLAVYHGTARGGLPALAQLRTGRFAVEPSELDGTPMRKGQYVETLIGAANRDPEVYDRPNTFDITRAPVPNHLAFSGGIHYCLGQPPDPRSGHHVNPNAVNATQQRGRPQRFSARAMMLRWMSEVPE
jgi:hypothetical protein